MSNYLSYKQIFQDRIKFRQAGGPNGSDFNNYDFPGAMYFRILFHFYNTPGTAADHDSNGFGLLHPTWQVWESNHEAYEGESAWVGQIDRGQRAKEYLPWRYNTAYSYLITNDEQERAQYLKHFITLLSNINSESPWYFKSIKGIEEAINRKQFTETFDFKDRGRLVIECMPDSFDQRIATLLDLYRAAAFSWSNKREIIPANLRKFDMSVIVFQVPIQRMHMPDGLVSNSFSRGVPNMLGQVSSLMFESDVNFATMDYKQSGPMQASYKIYEFHNCEFDYNSSTAAGDGLTNEEPFNTTYNIAILYDDMYESRYNQFVQFEPVEIKISNRAMGINPYEKEYGTKLKEARKILDDQAIAEAAQQSKNEEVTRIEALIAQTQAEINTVEIALRNRGVSESELQKARQVQTAKAATESKEYSKREKTVQKAQSKSQSKSKSKQKSRGYRNAQGQWQTVEPYDPNKHYTSSYYDSQGRYVEVEYVPAKQK